MDEWQTAFTEAEYDAIILGTGMKECLLSGLLAVDGMKVLHLDRNSYYGGACASVQPDQLYKLYKPDGSPNEAELGKLRDYNVDLIPKYIMADAQLVKVLIHTGVVNYMEYRPVDGSFVYRRGNIAKVPVTPKEAMSSPLMSTMEKTRAVQFFAWVDAYKADQPKTHVAGVFSRKTLDLPNMTGKDFLKYWALESDTCDFVTHALALFQDDSWMDTPANVLVEKIKLYKDSFLRFPNMTTPYIYPLYGLGELPQAFARLAAVYGGLYMLNRDIDEVVYDDSGKAIGVKAENVVAKAKRVIGDPSYFTGEKFNGLVKKSYKVVRTIAMIDHSIPNTNNCSSCQIIFPQNQVGRSNDIYLFAISADHKVTPSGHWLAIASTRVEGELDGLSAQQIAERELAAALPFIAPATEMFYDIYDMEEPVSDGTDNQVFISKSYDPTSHFETAVKDVLEMYQRITGKELELTDGPNREGAAQ